MLDAYDHVMSEIRNPRRKWGFIAIVGLLAISVGLFLYAYVPTLLTIEGLEMWSFVGWTSNFAGQVRQASFILVNNGTRGLTVNDFWVNDTKLDSGDLEVYGGPTLNVPGSMDVCLVPESYAFNVGKSYNFTVGTESGNHYSFIVRCDNSSVSPENMTIFYSEFIPGSPEYISIMYRNNGKTPLVITKVYLDGQASNETHWTWPVGWQRQGPKGGLTIFCHWMAGHVYIIRLITLVGNT
jgi:hypothetical protein